MLFQMVSFIFSLYFFYFSSKSTQMFKPQKRNSGVSFNDTLLNFGLRGYGSSLPVCSVSCTVHLQLFTNIDIL